MSATFDPPAVGEAFEHRGCNYTFAGDPQPHGTRDGRTVTLYAWLLECVACGAERTIRFGNRPRGNLSRRCTKCAARFIYGKRRPAGASA